MKKKLDRVKLDMIRAVFFPKNFYEKFSYLGSIPYGNKMDLIHTLVIAMDYEAKPRWCPRWFLRFLYLFGSDNSIVRVRNFTLHRLHQKLTKGIRIWDYKTKWSDYDLRISVSAPDYLFELSQAIETYVYNKGHKESLLEEIKLIEPNFKSTWLDINQLEEYLNKLEEKNEVV